MIINMPIETGSYDIHLDFNSMNDLKTYTKNYQEVFVITDEILYHIHAKRLIESLEKDPIFEVVKSGESSKSFITYERVINSLISKGIKRNSLIIAFGGGVIGDLAGFVSATLYRGIDYIQIPTSLLSMVDSSIGGKTGINTKQGKNLVGAFYTPKAVIIDPVFLETLPDKEYKNGMAEIIKAAMIKDSILFEKLENNSIGLLEMLERSILVKKHIVDLDPKEENLRMLLNFGHSFGHAIEQKSGYTTPHGFAVAEGMVLAVKTGIKLNITNKMVLKRMHNVMDKYDLGQLKEEPLKLIDQLLFDKKFKNGKLNLILVKDIGDSIIYPITKEEIYECYHKETH